MFRKKVRKAYDIIRSGSLILNHQEHLQVLIKNTMMKNII